MDAPVISKASLPNRPAAEWPAHAPQLSSLDVLRRGPRIDIIAMQRPTKAALERRKKDRKPNQAECGSGAIWKYAHKVGPARHGAATHQGAQGEARCYADI